MTSRPADKRPAQHLQPETVHAELAGPFGEDREDAASPLPQIDPGWPSAAYSSLVWGPEDTVLPYRARSCFRRISAALLRKPPAPGAYSRSLRFFCAGPVCVGTPQLC